jgi:hypothetical protein
MALPQLNVPKYELKVPSTGKSVRYRPYLVKEEKILMIALESQDENQMIGAIKDLILGCTDGEVNVSKLTMFDLEYVFTKIRTKSVGETTKIKIPCESCEASVEVEVDLETGLKVSEGREKKIPLTDDTGLIMKYPSIDDYMDVTKSNDSEIDKIFKLIIRSIETIYSGDEVFDASTHSEKELISFIESLNSAQFLIVKDFFDNMPQASIDVEYKCASCGHDHTMELKGMSNFFG